MKPFNLELAKAGHPVCTADGKDVRIICFDKKDPTHPIIALINFEDRENVVTYTIDGKFSNTCNSCNTDLRMKTIKIERWINIYKDPTILPSYRGYMVYSSKEEALKGINPNKEYIATVQVGWEE